MRLRNWTPFVFLSPWRYVSVERDWSTFDLEAWSDQDYEWTGDPWNGLRDFASPPAEIVDAGKGDCEDYALVAASWAIARGREDVGLGFCWEWPSPWARHVIAYDETRVYSSGQITRESVEEWLAGSRYAYCLRRPLR